MKKKENVRCKNRSELNRETSENYGLKEVKRK